MVQIIGDHKYYFIGFIIFWILGLFLVLKYGNLDILFFLNEQRTIFLDRVFAIITKFGETSFYFIAAFIYLFIRYRDSVSIGIVGILSLLISTILKVHFAHPRPMVLLEQLGRTDEFSPIPGIKVIENYMSFPSGHTTAGFAICTFIALTIKTTYTGLVLLCLGVLVGLSRMYLGQHFLEDVLFGSFLGVAIGTVWYYIAENISWPAFFRGNLKDSMKSQKA